MCRPCNARRMVATAADRTDHVLPALPVRQWVRAVPKRLRYFLPRDADLQGAALRLLLRAMERYLRAHRPGSGPAARLGAVAFIHRFGSRLAALVPPPRLHRHRYVGVLAANSPLRAAVTAVALAATTAPPRIAPARGPPLRDRPDAGAGGFDPRARPAPEYEFDQRMTWSA